MELIDSSEITPEVLLRAYACGIFPMAESADDPTLFWVKPETRGVIPLDGFRISSGLRARCAPMSLPSPRIPLSRRLSPAAPRRSPGRHDTWINKRIRDLYIGLHELGTLTASRSGERRSGGRPLRCQPRACVFRRKHVSPQPRRFESGAGASGGPADRGRLRAVGHPICHRASAQLSARRISRRRYCALLDKAIAGELPISVGAGRSALSAARQRSGSSRSVARGGVKGATARPRSTSRNIPNRPPDRCGVAAAQVGRLIGCCGGWRRPRAPRLRAASARAELSAWAVAAGFGGSGCGADDGRVGNFAVAQPDIINRMFNPVQTGTAANIQPEKIRFTSPCT